MPKYTPSDVTLRVTAGSSYDPSTHVQVSVNTPTPIHISSPLIDADLCVRIKNYHGLPRGSPDSSPYFEGERPAQGGWLYSIAFGFTLKRPDRTDEDEGEDEVDGVAAADLQWGNDFDRPVRAHLPPGFNAALRIAKWLIDPGLDGDVYADRPYLFGPVLSSMNTVFLGKPSVSDGFGIDVVEGEAASKEPTESSDSQSARHKLGIPPDSTERMRWALRKDWSGRMAALQDFVWQYDTPYGVDFANAYLDFADYSLRLPGYSLGVLSVWDGQPFRYVLRNKRTGEAYLVVVFDLLVKEELNEDGTVKEAVRVRKGVRVSEEEVLGIDEELDEKVEEQAEEKMERGKVEEESSTAKQTSADDVD
jgi:hypothetical protein